MRSKQAGEFFHGNEGYNCAQSVLKAFQDVFDIADEQIKEFSAFGGGRAEEGMCGALYAARSMVTDCQKVTQLEQLFQEQAGAIKCKEIRKLHRLSCTGCVKTAARILDTLN